MKIKKRIKEKAQKDWNEICSLIENLNMQRALNYCNNNGLVQSIDIQHSCFDINYKSIKLTVASDMFGNATLSRANSVIPIYVDNDGVESCVGHLTFEEITKPFK